MPARGSRGFASDRPTVASCLATLGVDDPKAAFSDAPDLDERFKIVKRFYHKAVLREHPDKGGDREMFEEIQKAFETLKATYQSRAVSRLPRARVHRRGVRVRGIHAPEDDALVGVLQGRRRGGAPVVRVRRAKTGRGHCEMSKLAK